ncbi:hypothetical protein [Bradyrhizobium aeschynomenes]|uniref:hypothetical protein n=1 Tax=Bradyrhizobium aeschynomenes TaxID=2734909 RepID=UPI001555CD73|nr:hypothetical protein [Bradyrhizobium aeschynomenes]NPV22856.1 hypothetical protein [Bradyrhizobium aeschynomenes]
MPLLPFGEYRPDVSDYEGQATHNIQNVVPRGDGYGPFPSFSSYTSALPEPCRGAFYALKSDGTVVTFAGTATKLYRLNNTDFTWLDVSKGGASYSQLSSSAQWQFAQTGNLVFATQANALLQVFDLTSSSVFDNALGAPPQAAYISVVGRFLVLSGLLSTPYRIQWSGLNNFNSATSWDGLTAGSDHQDFPDGGIVRGVAGGEAGIIFQDQAIRRMSYVPGSPIIFQIDRITQDKGLYAPYSIIRAGERIFFYAGQGFHKIEPGGVPQPIGREKVDRTFLADLDKGNLQLLIGAADPRSTRVFWSYKSVSGAIGSYDKLLGYDFLLDRFFSVAATGEYLLGMSQTGLTLENLDSISSSIDAMTLSLDAYATAVQPEIAQFSAGHVLGFFRGSNLEATIESAEQGTDDNRIMIRGFRPVTDATALYGSVSARDTPSALAVASAEIAVNGRTGRCDVRKDTRYARFKVRIPAAASWTFCAGVVPDLSVSGTL